MSETGSQRSYSSSTPLLPTTTSSHAPASQVLEHLSSRSTTSSSLYVFDLAEQVGFGTLTKEWSRASPSSTCPVSSLQTRAGAGLSLIGRLSEGSSTKGTVLTAYASLNGLSLMAPALASLPPASASNRLVIQVPILAPVGDSLALAPSVEALATVLQIVPQHVVVLISATPQEVVDFGALAYKLPNAHVIHLFDQYSAGREIPSRSLTGPEGEVREVDLKKEGLIYSGDKSASTVLVMLNGPLAILAKAFVEQTPGLGLVIVKVLRPFDEDTLHTLIPTTVNTIHVIDEVPNTNTQGALFVDVFGSFIGSSIKTHSKTILPTDVLAFVNDTTLFASFLSVFAPDVQVPDSGKKMLFLGTPPASTAPLASTIHSVFSSTPSLSSRLLVDHDVFSKPGGITASRILLSSKTSSSTIPIPFSVPYKDNNMDFTVVQDENLVKTHEFVKYAKEGSAVLVVTKWTPAELIANLPVGVPETVVNKKLHLYAIDGSEDEVYLAFLRLYLGRKATEQSVWTVAKASGVVEDDGKVSKKAWDSLVEIELPTSFPPQDDKADPRRVEFNAVVVEVEEGEVVNGAFLGSWHDAAKHLIFPAVYNPLPLSSVEEEEFPQIKSLRPEVPDRTYLVTCSVNRRLTPTEYDRNVFHLEFDTSGTGLKYQIGEALGIHGWNDEGDVRSFCESYGVPLDRLITIPVPGGEGKMHTRTVLQALLQQIDLFGKPPKSFYTDLAAYAANSVDRHALLFIGSPEGSATFKKYSEKDTVTFADVLMMYKSARPGIEVLCELIGDIKPRHYSIASAQSVVGDRVDLLVVTVDWVTPSGVSCAVHKTNFSFG